MQKKYSLNEYSENEIFNDAQAYLVKILDNVKQSKSRKISCGYIADPKNENSYIKNKDKSPFYNFNKQLFEII